MAHGINPRYKHELAWIHDYAIDVTSPIIFNLQLAFLHHLYGDP